MNQIQISPEHQQIINNMDVPYHKTDLSKDKNVVWLLQNLGQRNGKHLHYPQVMQHLIGQARRRNLLKRSVLDEMATKFV